MYFCYIFLLYPIVIGIDCQAAGIKTFKLQIKSDTSFLVKGPVYPNGISASAMYGNFNPNPHTGGIAIWEIENPDERQYNKVLTFTKSFYIPGDINSATLYYNADDQAHFYINNTDTGCYSNSWFNSYAATCNMKAFLRKGSNEIKATVINHSGPGLISFRLEVELVLTGI